MPTITDTIRNTALDSMVDQLRTQQDRRADFVVPASALRAENGLIKVEGENLVLDPTEVMIETMGHNYRLDMPKRHMLEFKAGAKDPDVALANLAAFDAVVNARLVQAAIKGRNYLVRTFTAGDDDNGIGVGRALLSNKYQIIDNFDVLMSVLNGITESGVEVNVEGCDLNERNMRVRFSAPAIKYLATEWLKGYRNPYGNGAGSHSGYDQGQEPIVFAGFEVSNSETGGGKFIICPRFVVQICQNGARLTKHAISEVHAGGRLEHGQINFADDTQQASLELVSKMTRDAVASFLDADFLEARINELTEEGKAEVPVDQTTEVIERVAKTQRWSDEEQTSILGAFIQGGQFTAGGVMQAVTAAAQHVPDPERAAKLEDLAIDAMRETARLVAV